jgi:nicotinamide mononucleotide transporter
MRKWIWGALIIASVVLLMGAYTGWIPLSPVEVWGFITGATCVLLVVEQNIWNFPVGIANNIFFIMLFLSSRLYGDMGLQVIYVALGIHGWHQWLHGGVNHTMLRVSRLRLQEGVTLAVIGLAATTGLTYYFIRIHDAAPFLDALTTVLSLIAQYLLNRKRLENWYVWITADVFYIGLYMYKHLYLTAVLYALFIGMCLAGLAAWKRSLREEAVPATEEVLA